VDVGLVTLGAQPVAGSSAVYEVRELANARQVVVTDLESGKILALSNLRYSKQLKMLELSLVNSSDDELKVAEHPLSLEVTSAIREAALTAGTIRLEVSREDGGELLATRTIAGTPRRTRGSFSRSSISATVGFTSRRPRPVTSSWR